MTRMLSLNWQNSARAYTFKEIYNNMLVYTFLLVRLTKCTSGGHKVVCGFEVVTMRVLLKPNKLKFL